VIKGWVGDKSFSWTSSFKTESEKHCSPFAEDCGPGQACYLGADDTQCAWRGIHPEGQECQYQNDCTPGTTCINNRCMRLCEVDSPDSAFGCNQRCPLAHTLLSTHAQFAVCDIGACRPGDTQCGEESACVLGKKPTCSLPGDALAGEPCMDSLDCAKNFGCVETGQSHPTCQPLCDASTLAGTDYELFPSELSPCATACPQNGFLLTDHPDLGICTDSFLN